MKIHSLELFCRPKMIIYSTRATEFITQTFGRLGEQQKRGWQLFRHAMLPLLHQRSLHFMPSINPLLHSTPLLRNISANSRAFSPRMISFSVRQSSLGSIAPLEAILFDIDGTICDSDPLHYYAFREMLQEIGFNGGQPISEEFYVKKMSGKHNEELCPVLFPNWEIERGMKFMDDKEAMFRRMALEQLKPVTGLDKLCKWVKDRGLKRAAVTNAPRRNAELMISIVGLGEFFQHLIIGIECERAKPFPDPYLKALQELGVSSAHAFIFEDSVNGIKSGVAAAMPVVALATRNPEKLLSDAGASVVIKDFADSKLWTALEILEKKTEAMKITT